MIEAIIDHLKQHSKLENSTDVERFDATLSQIAASEDPRLIGLLLPFFRDDCKFPDVMFSLIHTIERFEDQTYAHEILKSLPRFWKRAPYWTTVLHFRILNSTKTLDAYSRQLQSADPATREAVKEIMTAIRGKKTQFIERCDEILRTLSSPAQKQSI